MSLKVLAIPLMSLLALSSTVLAEDPEKYRIVIKDHVFNPDTLEIPAGTRVKIEVHNQDSTAEEFESHELNREKIIAGNSVGMIFVGPLEPGVYPFFGEFNPDTAQGEIIVK